MRNLQLAKLLKCATVQSAVSLRRTGVLYSMRRVVVALVFGILATGCTHSARSISPASLTPADEVAQFSPPEPARWRLSNGLEVIFLRDNELPLVKGRLMLRGGALWAGRYPLGTTSAMGEGMRTGGAGSLSADALDRELEKLAAGISSSFSAEFGGVSFSCLDNDTERVFELFADVVMRPRFDGDRLTLWKGQALEGIRRRVEDPSTVASIAFTQLVYGDSPYGRVSRSTDISAIQRAHLVELHRYLVRPDGAILVITGKIDQAKAEQLTERYFGSWAPRGEPLPPAPAIDHTPKPGIYFIGLPFAQASVKFGHLGLPRFTPDYPAIDVFNEVFGSGGFGSRLMKRVRTELGLSYGIYGGIAPGRVRGTNYVFVQTKADSTGSAINESIRELEKLQQEQPSADEVAEKKLAISNSYVFNFGSQDEIAGRLASHELLEYPKDYDKTYLGKIQAVGPAEVQTVAASRWHPAELVVVVVGNEASYAALERERGNPGSRLAGFELIKLGFKESVSFPPDYPKQ
jgi:zinc protease